MNDIIPLKIMGGNLRTLSREYLKHRSAIPKFITLTVNHYICHHLLYLSLTCLITMNLFPDYSVILSHELPCSAGKSGFSYKPISQETLGEETSQTCWSKQTLWISKWGLLWFFKCLESWINYFNNFNVLSTFYCPITILGAYQEN